MPEPRSFSLLLPALILALVFSGGCTGLQSGYETPIANVSSFKALPGDGMVPRFEIGLHIVNPNRTPLELEGVAYTISIEGHKILTGVSNDLPVIEAYGDGIVMLRGNVSLFNSIAFFTSLARKKDPDVLSYRLEVKLDTGALRPVIRINETGTFSLASGQ
ncbi:MAG: LEA type 2 family protein [Desulfobacterales bacterium]|nr:LEA type 2 family protein [Desulfobacterales bacterium]